MVTLMGTAMGVALQMELPRDHPSSHSSQQPSKPHAMELDSILRCFRSILKKLRVTGMSLQSGFPVLGRAENPQITLQHFLSCAPSHHAPWLHSKSKEAEIYFCWALTLLKGPSNIFSGVITFIS